MGGREEVADVPRCNLKRHSATCSMQRARHGCATRTRQRASCNVPHQSSIRRHIIAVAATVRRYKVRTDSAYSAGLTVLTVLAATRNSQYSQQPGTHSTRSNQELTIIKAHTAMPHAQPQPAARRSSGARASAIDSPENLQPSATTDGIASSCPVCNIQ